MRIITRYVLAEVCKQFLLAVTILTLLMLIGVVAKEAQEYGLGPTQIIQLVPYILPEALRFTVPGTILFSVCLVFGRMSGANEIVALKAMGINPMVVMWPIFLLAVALSLGTVVLNDLAVSWGRNGVRRVVIESVEDIVYSMLRMHRSYNSQRFSIIVKGVDGRKLLQPRFTYQRQGSKDSISLWAKEAELRSDPDKNQLTMICRDGRLEYGADGKMAMDFQDDEFEQTIPLDSGLKAEGESPSWIPLRLIPQVAARQRRLVRTLEEEYAAKGTFQMLAGDFQTLTGPEWFVQQEDLKANRNHLYRVLAEPHRRWSNGFSCLCFVMIGVPLAVYKRNAEFFGVFFVCFAPILVLYYPLMATSTAWAKSGSMPPVVVWLGNAVLALVGLYYIRKVRRY